MKNQYFGDINDYRKYGLLRVLQSRGNGRLLVAWMLTPDEAPGWTLGDIIAPSSGRSAQVTLPPKGRSGIALNRLQSRVGRHCISDEQPLFCGASVSQWTVSPTMSPAEGF